MKKVLIASAALFIVAITNVNAQTNPATEKKEVAKPQTTDQQTKTPVKPEALPQAIKTATAGEDYKGWVVSSAFQVKGTTEYYELVLTKEKETKTVKMDANGKPII